MIPLTTLLVAVFAVASGQFQQFGQQQQGFGQQQQGFGQQQQVFGQQQQVNQRPSTQGFTCSTPNGTYEYTLDCRKYYKCDNSVATIMSCAQQMLFNRNNALCDWPANVTCAVNPPPKDYIKQELANLCAINPYGGSNGQVFLKKHPRYCNMYFTCSVGYIFPKCDMCAPGTYFNSDEGKCLRLPVDETFAKASKYCNGLTYTVMKKQVLARLSPDCFPFSDRPNPNEQLYKQLVESGYYN